MTDDDLRELLTKALSEFEVFTDSDGHLSIRMKDPWADKERVDALMPIVREALAAAWDEGAEEAYEWQIGVTGKPDNPWREGQ